MLDGAPLRVFAHNVECVPRLDALVRDPRASFAQSLEVLRRARELRPDVPTKSSLMVGVGETDDEVLDALRQLRDAGVELLTLGQYLAPGRPGTRFLPVDRYVPPEQFAAWEQAAREMGFEGVAAGPLVRSSYRAGELYAAGDHESPSGSHSVSSSVGLRRANRSSALRASEFGGDRSTSCKRHARSKRAGAAGKSRRTSASSSSDRRACRSTPTAIAFAGLHARRGELDERLEPRRPPARGGRRRARATPTLRGLPSRSRG